MALAGAIVGMAGSLVTSDQESRAYKAQAVANKRLADYQADTLEENARFSDESALDAVKRGDINAERLLTSARTTQGAQRASYGSQGVDVNSGSAVDVVNDVADQSRIDAGTIRSNAWKEALGLKFDAAESRRQAGFSRLKGTADASALNKAANTSLATGGLKAADALITYRSRKAPTA